MNIRGAEKGSSAMVESFRNVITRVGAMFIAQRLVPVPIGAGRLVASAVSSSRQLSRLLLLAGLVLLPAIPAWAGNVALPAGVPNIFDEMVQEQYQPVGVANLGGNADFPAVLLENIGDDQPQAILIGLDARNGKDTWSLTDDPIILIVVFSDPATIKALYLDSGIAKHGKESGDYTKVDEVDPAKLPDLLKTVTESLAQTYM